MSNQTSEVIEGEIVSETSVPVRPRGNGRGKIGYC